MYKMKIKPNKTRLRSVDCVEGETLEDKIERIVSNGEAITDGAPEIYTDRKDGVISGHNIRTDRWEIANDAMTAVNKSIIAKREGKADGKVVKLEQKKDIGDEPTHGKVTSDQ